MLKVVHDLVGKKEGRLQLVVSGHVHRAHGIAKGTWMGGCKGMEFVDAATCREIGL
jgi:hypothetical protein